MKTTNVENQNRPVAIITGAAQRIGAAIARHLHKTGYNIIVHYNLSHDAAVSLVQDMNKIRPDSAKAIPANLLQQSAARQLIEDSFRWHCRLDVLINNASLFIRDSVNPLDNVAAWDEMLKVNVQAPFWLSHAARPHLAQTNGAIINITDIHAQIPLKGYSCYCQSKAALTLQTLALAREFAPQIRVNAVAPGAIIWPQHNNALHEDIQTRIIEKTPLKRHGEPIFIAQAVCACIDNPFITGQTLSVDGGRSTIR